VGRDSACATKRPFLGSILRYTGAAHDRITHDARTVLILMCAWACCRLPGSDAAERATPLGTAAQAGQTSRAPGRGVETPGTGRQQNLGRGKQQAVAGLP